MHESRADRTNFDIRALSSLREDDKRQPPLRCPSDGPELPFRLGMIGVREDDDGAADTLSISPIEIPCFWHLPSLASSQSKPENSMLSNPE